MNEWKVSSVWEPPISFLSTLKESKPSTSEGTPLVKGINDKAKKTCAGIGLIQLSSYLLASAAKQVLVN